MRWASGLGLGTQLWSDELSVVSRLAPDLLPPWPPPLLLLIADDQGVLGNLLVGEVDRPTEVGLIGVALTDRADEVARSCLVLGGGGTGVREERPRGLLRPPRIDHSLGDVARHPLVQAVDVLHLPRRHHEHEVVPGAVS